MIDIYTDDIFNWMNKYSGQRFHSVLSDPPYALISIGKRFGKKGAAKAQFGSDGRYSRLSNGFMGQTWDSFESLVSYQGWVSEWATALKEILFPGAVCAFFGSPRTWHRLACGLEDAGFDIYDTIMWVYGQGFPKSHNIGKGIDRAAGIKREVIGKQKAPGYAKSDVDYNTQNRSKLEFPIYINKGTTSEGQAWSGYGTALKPAWEPIIICRVPRGDYTFAQLATKFGTGALNIDGSRVPTDESYIINTFNDGAKPWGDGAGHKYTGRQETKGRWPANIITEWPTRYFYCPKASKKEKGDYNNHPTVKPLDLATYLATLLIPPTTIGERRMFVPFSGSGSEAIGSALAGWETVVAVEREIKYNKIAKRRITEVFDGA